MKNFIINQINYFYFGKMWMSFLQTILSLTIIGKLFEWSSEWYFIAAFLGMLLIWFIGWLTHIAGINEAFMARSNKGVIDSIKGKK